MKKELKNRGLNAPVIVVAAIIVLAIVVSFFTPGNAIGDAPFFNKALGTILLVGAGVYGWKSGEWFDFIENDRIHLWVQILGTFALLLLALLVLAVWHGGAL